MGALQYKPTYPLMVTALLESQPGAKSGTRLAGNSIEAEVHRQLKEKQLSENPPQDVIDALSFVGSQKSLVWFNGLSPKPKNAIRILEDRMNARSEAVPSLIDAFDQDVALDEEEEGIDRDQHFIFGMPSITSPDSFRFTPVGGVGEVDGYSVHEKEAFTIGHYEKFKVPAWVAMKWTKDNLESSTTFDRDDFEFQRSLGNRDFDFFANFLA